MLAGLILAGGRSSRFGSDKAAALLRGRSFLHIAALRLQGRCAQLAVSARPGSVSEEMALRFGLTVLADREGDAAGPLAGIHAGLAWAQGLGAEALAVRPIDTPLIPEDTLDHLQRVLGDAPAAYCATDDGPEPLCSLWTLAALPMLDEALAGERHPGVYRFLDSLGAAVFHAPNAGLFANVNTPEELAAAEAAAGR